MTENGSFCHKCGLYVHYHGKERKGYYSNPRHDECTYNSLYYSKLEKIAPGWLCLCGHYGIYHKFGACSNTTCNCKHFEEKDMKKELNFEVVVNQAFPNNDKYQCELWVNGNLAIRSGSNNKIAAEQEASELRRKLGLTERYTLHAANATGYILFSRNIEAKDAEDAWKQSSELISQFISANTKLELTSIKLSKQFDKL